MDAGDDWDLSAVVRGCRSRPPAAAAADPFASSLFKVFESRQDMSEQIFPSFTSRRYEELEELYRPFLLKPLHQCQQAEVYSSGFSSPAAARAASLDPTPVFVPKNPQRPASLSPRSKREKFRKKQLKKVVCQIPADGVSSDSWAWRKYGQKPIKGSPYPRGYYRCSSFRGCPARKQVERNRTDPRQMIITYTSEHNHPMPDPHRFPSNDARTELASSPTTSTSMDGDEEEEEAAAMLMVEEMEMIGKDELVFVGDAVASAKAEVAMGAPLFEDDAGFDDRLFASPWLDSSNNSSATAAAC